MAWITYEDAIYFAVTIIYASLIGYYLGKMKRVRIGRKNYVPSEKVFTKRYFFGFARSGYRNYNSMDTPIFWKSVFRTIRKYNISGSILDIGCAFGFLLKYVQREFNGAFTEFCGFDISDYALGEAKRHAWFADLKQGDLNKSLPYKGKKFKLITALNVLEQTLSIKESLLKIAPILADDGILIIEMPISNTWAAKLFRFIDMDITHGKLPHEKYLEKIINEARLEILKKEHFFPTPWGQINFLPVSVRMVLRKRQN